MIYFLVYLTVRFSSAVPLCANNEYSLNSTCYVNCPLGYYGDKTNYECLACHTSCKSCSGPEITSCSSCTAPLLLYPDPTGSCIPSCPSLYYFQDNPNGKCAKCNKTCLKCTGANSNQCTACELPRVFSVSTNECDC